MVGDLLISAEGHPVTTVEIFCSSVLVSSRILTMLFSSWSFHVYLFAPIYFRCEEDGSPLLNGGCCSGNRPKH